jgi:ABC-2 type transport system ATP-binding protein
MQATELSGSVESDTPLSSAPVLKVSRLTKEYRPPPRWLRFFSKSALTAPLVALEAIDLEVQAGSICAVVGPNGAGKSTLFRILMGLTTPTEGRAEILGHDASACPPALRRSLGFMASDDRSLLLRLTCSENLAFHGRLHGLRGAVLDQRVGEVLEQVGLSHARHRAAFALSAGMRARLQIARATLHRPSVLILDEPTGTLDPVAAYDLLELVRRMTKERGLAVMLSSHRLEEIEALDETVLLLDQGRRVYLGPLSALRTVDRTTEVVLELGALDDAIAAEQILRATAEVISVQRNERSIEVTAGTTAGGVIAALGPLAVGVLHIAERSGATREVLRRAYAEIGNGGTLDG